MIIKAKVQKHILFFLFIIPILFFFAYGMLFARADDGEIFFPLIVVSTLFFLFGIFAIKELYTQITQTKEYSFDIDEQRIKIDIFVNNDFVESYEIQKSNLKSFENSYFNNYGLITTTYVFTLNDGKIIQIKEDFGKSEKEIFDAFITYMYLPRSMIEQ